MKLHRLLPWAAAPTILLARPAAGVPADFDFRFSYQTLSMTGRIVGLNLDAGGNATNADPAEVLLYTVPANVGITASPSQPYVFVPHTYEQWHEDFFTHLVTINSTTTPGVYGFNVSGGQIEPSPLDLTLVDSANVVNVLFNAQSFVLAEGATATYGMTADGEYDALWPTVNSFVSYTSVPEPAGASLLTLGTLGVLRRPSRHRR